MIIRKEIAVKPTKITQDFIYRNRGPNVQAYKNLTYDSDQWLVAIMYIDKPTRPNVCLSKVIPYVQFVGNE